MKRRGPLLVIALAGLVGLGVGGYLLWRPASPDSASAGSSRAARPSSSTTGPGSARNDGLKKNAGPAPVTPPAGAHPPKTGLTAAEKAAWAERIKRDYAEIQAKASADFSEAGQSYPGGLPAYLRQLSLLEREMRLDLAAVLSPHELEDFEMRETRAGQLTQKLLGDTTATDEQRRAAFRLQEQFDDKYALTFDLTPAVLLERETARQATQRAIQGALGDDTLFAAWVRGEGPEYDSYAALASQQGLPASAALDLWKARNDYTLARLELSVHPPGSPEELKAAQVSLAQATRNRLLGILGPAGFTAAGSQLSWMAPVK